MEWEKISKNIYRCKVPGGWIVKYVNVRSQSILYGESASICFVPDPNHLWNV